MQRRPAAAQTPSALPPEAEARARVIIEHVDPEIDHGRHPIKRVVGEQVTVEADVFAEGHDRVAARLLYRGQDAGGAGGGAGGGEWLEVPMQPLVNDRRRGSFTVERLGRAFYTVIGWVDHFATWRHDLGRRVAADQDIRVDLLIGVRFIEEAASRASGADAGHLREWAERLGKAAESDQEAAALLAKDDELAALMDRWADRTFATRYEHELEVIVDRERAAFSTWYELFPRSCAEEPGGHGTFRDVEKRLPYIAEMGFDVLYLPPIHPIGRERRKGRNNAPTARPGDVGSPWGIGSAEGGHKSIHPDLGTLEDFHHLIAAARQHGMEIALDIAFQCAPDHPYVKEHPEWFRSRPDGTVQYAENPPKKYQDIYPFNFETDAWESLWVELLSVLQYWIEQGVKIFRVDNPHTKPFAFWEWAVAQIRREHPEVILLSEAFTRPKVMRRLAKLGYTQSYTYFAWKNTRAEMEEYFTELTQTDMREYYRPNAWPNTPDILNEYLQHGGRPAFMARLVLAATLTANYGIYGPAFELCEHVPREPGSEEYLNSEKYEVRRWDLSRPDSLREFIARVNAIRRANPALHRDRSLRFHAVDNQMVIGYSKRTGDLGNVVVTTVNLDPHHTQSGWIELPLEEFEIDEDEAFQVHDLLTDAHYIWRGRRNYIEMNPHVTPAHIFLLRRRSRTEQDFEYFM